MAAPKLSSNRLWINDRDPGTSESTGMAPIEQWDEWQNISSADKFLCTDATPDALVWLLVSGGGIKTFNPLIVGSSQAGTASYSVQSGNYQRIGKLVMMNISLQWSGHTGTGNMSVGGLAIAPSAAFIQKCEVHVQNVSLPLLTLSTVAKTNAGTGRLDLFGTIAGALDSAVQMSSAGIVNLQMNYF